MWCWRFARLVEEALGQLAPPGRVDAAGAVFEPPRGEFARKAASLETFSAQVLAASSATDAMIRDMSAKDRDDVAAKMTPAQIAEALRLAREWKPE